MGTVANKEDSKEVRNRAKRISKGAKGPYGTNDNDIKDLFFI